MVDPVAAMVRVGFPDRRRGPLPPTATYRIADTISFDTDDGPPERETGQAAIFVAVG